MRTSTKRRRLNLALQGGGAHGAFTWGVLDRLLEDSEIDFGWISGTSAGAFNAVALAHGLSHGHSRGHFHGLAPAALDGGDEDFRTAAREALNSLWHSVEKARVPDLISLNPFLSTMARSTTFSGAFSPYSFNPLGFDPLRKILNQTIDFEAIRRNENINVVIAATDVATGRPRMFQREEITVDTVLASACLPTLHHAVEIGGRMFWDGGFSANPDLLTIARASPVEDTLLVLLNPIETGATPRTAAAIEDRVNTITFNQPLLRDIAVIVAAQRRTPPSWWRRLSGKGRNERLGRHRFHMIEAAHYTAEMEAKTKVTPNPEVLQYLHRAGRSEATAWLASHRGAIGRRASWVLCASSSGRSMRRSWLRTPARQKAYPNRQDLPEGRQG